MFFFNIFNKGFLNENHSTTYIAVYTRYRSENTASSFALAVWCSVWNVCLHHLWWSCAYTAIYIKIVFHVAGCCSTAAIRSMTINLILISHFRSYVTFFCFFHCDTNDCKHNDCHKCHLICMPFSQYVLFVFLSCICHTQDSLCLFAIEMQFLKSWWAFLCQQAAKIRSTEKT